MMNAPPDPPPSKSMMMIAAYRAARLTKRRVDPEPVARESAGFDQSLGAMGFGPGMLIRLRQLGLRTASDLAGADASQLRSALGDISRLIDVEGWIRLARQTVQPGEAD